ITFLLADALDVDPIPLVIIEIIASNIGGTATLIGDPPNILIAGATDLSFGAFIANLAPIAALAFVVVTVMLYRGYRDQLRIHPKARQRVMELDAAGSIEDRDELVRTVPILVLTIFVFFFHKALHLEPATVALAGATVMLLTTRQSLEGALAGIEWPTLFFFLGLFVMVGALEETGAIGEVADGIASVTDGNRTAELLGITWVSALGSGLVDNIPFTATMIPVVEQLQGGNNGDDAYWWALALGACFGGNATLIAAAANVAAAGMASRAGRPIGFTTFLRAGLPATAVSLVLATAYIGVRYL
ncbi:MAG TPA: SLC13 family permease, partial [Thermoleophilaceae bacterium]|nr:SLC13 family permease [Thermoleophilaceae bacterium]